MMPMFMALLHALFFVPQGLFPFPGNPVIASFPAFDCIFDFRNTSGFVTDPANGTFVIGVDGMETNYPTSPVVGGSCGTPTMGWEINAGSVGSRDRNAGINAQLAGINFVGAAQTVTWRLDLPSAGTYSIYLGYGDPSFNSVISLVVNDTNTAKVTITAVAVLGGSFGDATGTVFGSSAAWTSGETPVSAVFSTTILRVVLGPVAAQSLINTIRVQRTA